MSSDQPDPASLPSSRRAVLAWLGVAGALGAAYGTLAAFMGRFLYPARPPEKGWLYVAQTGDLPVGGALVFETPAGARVNVTRQGQGVASADFVALGSTCPHLGCQVHWEPQNGRFFCPCHNGVFEPGGKAIGGPPGEAGLSLPKFPLKVDQGLLFMEVPLAELALGPGRLIPARKPGCRGCGGCDGGGCGDGHHPGDEEGQAGAPGGGTVQIGRRA